MNRPTPNTSSFQSTTAVRQPPGVGVPTNLAQVRRGQSHFEEVVSGYLVGCNVTALSDTEWDDCLRFFTDNLRTMRGTLVMSEAGLTGAQRAKLVEVLKGRRAPRAALITRSAFVRGILVAWSWAGLSNARAFAPHQLAQALDYLEVPERSRPAVEELATRMLAKFMRLAA